MFKYTPTQPISLQYNLGQVSHLSLGFHFLVYKMGEQYLCVKVFVRNDMVAYESILVGLEALFEYGHEPRACGIQNLEHVR